MKKAMLVLIGPLVVLLALSALAGDPFEELMENFDKEYNAIKPPSEYSSVNSDYKLGQAAIGTMYTTKALGLLYSQNKELLERYNEMLQKYDKVIEQNREIIKLLTIITKEVSNREKQEAESTPWNK